MTDMTDDTDTSDDTDDTADDTAGETMIDGFERVTPDDHHVDTTDTTDTGTDATDGTDTADDGPGLARAMVEAQHHHAKAAEQLAKGRTATADHHLFKAFSALGDYLNEGDWKVEPAGDDD